MSDYTALKRLAESCGNLNWRFQQENWTEYAIRDDHGYIAVMRVKSAKHPGPDPDREAKATFLGAATPATVLALIAENEELGRYLCTCRDCGGEGSVHTGEWHSYSPMEPPEPVMVKCGECDGTGLLGEIQDLYQVIAERDQLKADKEALVASYARSGEREHELRVERSTLREAVKFAASTFKTITSSDGSGHADLAEAVLRIAGAAMGEGEES